MAKGKCERRHGTTWTQNFEIHVHMCHSKVRSSSETLMDAEVRHVASEGGQRLHECDARTELREMMK